MAPADYPDGLRAYGEQMTRASQELRGVSRQILEAVDELRRLETRSRTMGTGTQEFRQISSDIEAISRGVFAMAGQQRSLTDVAEPEGRSLDELDEAAASEAKPAE